MGEHANGKERVLLINQGEISALKKAIMYLKFSCEDTESLLYAGSPLINSVLMKLIEVDDLGAQAKEFYGKKHIANEAFVLSKIQKMEKEIGKFIEVKMKDEAFKECVYPFPSDEKY